MKPKTYLTIVLLGSLAAFSISSSSAAPIVTTAGTDLNNPNWDTAGYGDVGYSFLQGSATPTFSQSPTGGVLAGGGSVTLTRNAADRGNPISQIALENPGGVGTFTAGAWFTTGLASGASPNVFTLTFTTGSPTSARIGILVGAAEFVSGAPLDYPISISLNGVKATVTKPTSYQADWYFFDVTNIAVNDTVAVSAEFVADSAGNRYNPINGVVISAIPEPGSIALLGLGIFGLILRRRR